MTQDDDSNQDPAFSLIAVTTFGLEAVVTRELEDLGYPKHRDGVDHGPGRVHFQGGPDAIARANVFLRTAERIQLLVHAFEAPDFDALFETARAIPWETWLPPGASFPVNGRSVRSQLSSVPALQRTVKRAIADRLMSVRHPGASLEARVDESGPEYRVEIAMLDNRASILLDTTGPGLNKRGYRDRVGDAQLRETLAASLVLLSRWTPERELIDPFCGTGTIAIEAAMIARDLAPGRHRGFASEEWSWIPPHVWAEARTEADDRAKPRAPARIIATDRDPMAIDLARRHAERAGVERDIHVQQRDFLDLSSKSEYGVIVTNPPYGQRLGDPRELNPLYHAFPTVLSRLPTWSVGVLTGFPGFEQAVARKADRRRKLFNARVEATYYQFDGPRPPRNAGDNHEHREHGDHDAPTPAARPTAPAAAPAFTDRTTEPHASTDAFLNRVAKMVHHRRRWPDTEHTDAYRLFQRDLPDVPLHIDCYGTRYLLTQVGRPRIDAELWRVQIQQLAEALIERLELKRNDLLIRAHGIRSDAATLRFTEHGLNFALQCAPEGPPPFRLDLRRARNWLRHQSESRVVYIDGDRDGSMILSALHAGAATVVTDAIAPARATVDAVAHANDLVLKGRLKPALAPGVPLADVGVTLCPKADDLPDALASLNDVLQPDARALLITGPAPENGHAVPEAAELFAFTAREHSRKTEPDDTPGWHQSWLLTRG